MIAESQVFHFHLFVFSMKWNDKTASDWVMIVYDAVMMQQNIFQGEMHITKCCLSQQGENALPDRHC